VPTTERGEWGVGMRRTLACAAVLVALALAGCKGSGGDDAAGTGGTTTAGSTAAAKAAGGEVTAENAPVSAQALCAHLKKEAPRIEAVGSKEGAMAQLTISIANLYGDHVDRLDGRVVDEQALKTCPDTRAELLKASGVESFGEL
jgi:hypothetical protein